MEAPFKRVRVNSGMMDVAPKPMCNKDHGMSWDNRLIWMKAKTNKSMKKPCCCEGHNMNAKSLQWLDEACESSDLFVDTEGLKDILPSLPPSLETRQGLTDGPGLNGESLRVSILKGGRSVRNTVSKVGSPGLDSNR